ncbi:MAG: RND transporter, partial [Betaproteobacteria bacterium]|nr:RND transporter [Betaproteobacteria bacterium]
MRRLIMVSGVLLTGCATFSEDGGFDRVEKAVAERGAGRAQWVRTEEAANSVRARVKELLGQPLSAEGAVQ